MAKIPHADDGLVCPFNGKDTADVCHKCPLWVMVRGHNHNTGQEVDDWRCTLAWLPMLLIENAQKQRETGAAIESFRNESVRAATTQQELQIAAMRQAQQLIPKQQDSAELRALPAG